MYKREGNNWLKHIDFMILDLVCIFASYILGLLTRFRIELLINSHGEYTNLLIMILLIEVVACLMLGNLSKVLRRGYFIELTRVVVLSACTLALTSLYMYVAHNAVVYSRLLLAFTFTYFVVIDWIARTLWKKRVIAKLQERANQGEDNRATIVISDRQNAAKIIQDIREDIFTHLSVKGLVLVDEPRLGTEVEGVPVVATLEDAPDYICRKWIDEIYVYLGSDTKGMEAFCGHCAEMGVTVHQVMVLGDIDEKKQFVERLGNHTVLTTAYSFIMPYQAIIKRTVDILGGLVGTIFTLVIAIFVGPIIYAKSPGPIFFKQKRIGRNGRQFEVLKFRSMYLDAEERKKELMAENRVGDGMMFKIEHDPRIIGNKQLPDGTWKTGIGEFIRKTSLDEFPQFINVLKGDMSLVGTRPPTLDEWEKYKYHHRARMAVKPGITGMWQVSGRSEITDFEEVVKLDTQYITKYRLSLDIKILFRTVKVLFERKGAM